MSDTLSALHAAVIDAPADRTVRLVYADALDECGAPSDAARAEFIRAQIALEPMAEDDPQCEPLVARCRELFAEHWIDWWRPVCAAVGLPEPYVPGVGLGQRVKRFFAGDSRPKGAPYTAYVPAWTIQSEEHGFSAQFIAGFPELLFCHHFRPGWGPELFDQWASATPLARLRFADSTMESWGMVDGPLLAKVVEIIFDRLAFKVVALVVRSSYLRGLAALKATPLAPDVVRTLVHNPPWAGLRSLALTGVNTPEAIVGLAESCTLEQLEELTFGVSEVPELPLAPAVGGQVGFALAEIWEAFFTGRPRPLGPIRWPDYWPALLTLARSPVLRRLRRLRIVDADPVANTLTGLFRQFDAPDPDAILSDECVLAVAAALDRDKLERLELPAARLTPACHEELARRFGKRFVPA